MQRMSAPLPRHSNQAGFTILEVLLAFVVFAMSFAVVMQIMSGSMRNTVRAREYTEVALVAQSVMDQVGLDIPLVSGTYTDGEFGDYHWELVINPFSGEGATAHTVELGEQTGIELLEVEFFIEWGEPPRQRSNRFSTVKAVLADRALPGI